MRLEPKRRQILEGSANGSKECSKSALNANAAGKLKCKKSIDKIGIQTKQNKKMMRI